MATHKQLARIHILKQERGMNDEDYREFLQSRFGVGSSKDLTRPQALDAIEALGGEKRKRLKGRFESDPGKRDGFATPRQLRMLEAMWEEVSYVQDEEKRKEAMDKFLFRRWKCWLRTVPQNKVGPIKMTLQAMIDKKNEGGPDGAA